MIDGEEKLIQNAIKGESSAFGGLYDLHHERIYRFVLVKVSHREEAEDLTHQVFLQAWQSIGSYRDMGFPFSSWLYRIARNLVVDHYRRARKDMSIEGVSPEELPAPDTLAARAHIHFEMERALHAMRALKPDHQDVVMMRFVDELPIRDVASILKKSEGAIKLIQHRALKRLRELLEEEEVRGKR